jgi:prepilin-type N-terminal cleavage/methylation domain-containing protein
MRGERRGYTLVEVVLALALAGLFVYGGAYSFQRLVPKFQLQSGIWEVTAGLNQARFRAIMSGEPVRVRFVTSGFVFERYDEAAKIWRTARAASLPGITVQANNSPVFHPSGTVSDLASITVSNAQGTYRITIAITGRVRTARIG